MLIAAVGRWPGLVWPLLPLSTALLVAGLFLLARAA
jgi:hypothetical protein